MAATEEVFLELSDFEIIGEEFRKLWNTRRLALDYPTATIVRYTNYPNPESINNTTIVNSDLNISENIVGRTLSLLEGSLSKSYVVTSYTTTSITVSGGDFVTYGFTTSCTFHIDGLGYQKRESPTKVQVETVGTESLIDRPVAYYNLTIQELERFGNELDMYDRRFVFYGIELENNDIIVLESQEYAVYKSKYDSIYGKSTVYGKALRKSV